MRRRTSAITPSVHERGGQAAARPPGALAREGERSIGQNLAMIGALGWTIVTPTLLGIFAGRWLDRAFDAGDLLDVGLLVAGLAVGCAWLEEDTSRMTDRLARRTSAYCARRRRAEPLFGWCSLCAAAPEVSAYVARGRCSSIRRALPRPHRSGAIVSSALAAHRGAAAAGRLSRLSAGAHACLARPRRTA